MDKDNTQKVNTDNIQSLEGMTPIKIDKEQFKKDLDILNAPSEY